MSDDRNDESNKIKKRCPTAILKKFLPKINMYDFFEVDYAKEEPGTDHESFEFLRKEDKKEGLSQEQITKNQKKMYSWMAEDYDLHQRISLEIMSHGGKKGIIKHVNDCYPCFEIYKKSLVRESLTELNRNWDHLRRREKEELFLDLLGRLDGEYLNIISDISKHINISEYIDN